MKTFYQFLNEVKINNDFTYYHGCSKSELGEKILKDGYLKPGNENIKRGSKLTPVIGKTYSTPDLREAIVYTIGGDFLGCNYWNDWLADRKGGSIGYLFEIDKNSFSDVIPDEDYVGQLIHYLNRQLVYFQKERDSQKQVIIPEHSMWYGLSKWGEKKSQRYLDLCKDFLTPLQYKKCILYDDYGDFAVAGKKLNKYLDDYWKDEIIKLGVPIANNGNLKFNNVWKFDKLNCPKLIKSGSNFFEFAEKVL